MSRKTEIIYAISAMLTGGMIYVLWRPDSLVMFSWFDSLGLRGNVDHIRELVLPYYSAFPGWVIYAMPQSLWFFSGLLAFDCIWAARDKAIYWFYFAGFSVIALSTELGQLAGIVPGYFDGCDFAALVLAGLIALILTSVTGIEEQQHDASEKRV